MKLFYWYSKFIRKYVIGKSIRNSLIDKTAKIASGSLVSDVKLGRYSYSGYDCWLINCEIGNYCSIAGNVYIGGAEHPMEWVSTSPVFQNIRHSGPTKRFVMYDVKKTKRTYIGSDVWIGHGVSVKAGVSIGHGAVIATGAVVTKDVEPYSVVGGCPAKFIKYRFGQDIRERLLTTEWWNLSDDKVAKIAPFIREPDKFLEEIEKIKVQDNVNFQR